MADFMGSPATTLLPQDPEALRLQRQRMLAEALMAQSQQPINPNRMSGRFMSAISPLEGLAKMVQAGVGAYSMRKADDRMQEMSDQRRQALVRALRGEAAPGSVPAEQFSDDAEMARMPGPFDYSKPKPAALRDPMTESVVGVTAPAVPVRGRLPQDAPPAAPDPMEVFRNRIADQLEAGSMTVTQAQDAMMRLEEMKLARQMKLDEPVALPEGAQLVTRTGEVLAKGAPKDSTATAGGILYDKRTGRPIAGQFTRREGNEEVTYSIGPNGQPQEVARGAAFNPNPLVQLGADLVPVADQNSPTGVKYVRKVEAAGMPAPPSSSGKATEGERLSKGYYDRMVNNEAVLQSIGDKGFPTVATDVAGSIPLVGGYARRKTQSVDQQKYRQAQEDWVRAKLRKESGAVIGDEEMDREISVYFAQPGDHPEVIKQKIRSREVAQQAMRDAAGVAIPSTPTPQSESPAAPTPADKKPSGADQPLTPQEREELQRLRKQVGGKK